MATAYLLPIKTAAALFPLLALVLLLPTAVLLYRRHGVMSRGRTLSVYGFLYYSLTAFCMTIVPLPKQTADMCQRFAMVAHPQWMPGNTFRDIWKEADHKIGLNALVLQNPAVAGTLFNLLLLLPLGIFLRYHFVRSLRATALIGFTVSLFFELTQWTGVWGLYNCPYRLFDVDDLIVNTAGAMAGWLLAGPVARMLPTLETLDGRALAARPVPFGRRLTALVVDVAGYVLASVFAMAVMTFQSGTAPTWTPIAVFVAWFVLLPLATGTTPGKRLLLLKLVADDGGPLLPWRLTLRALLLGALAMPFLSGLFLAVVILLNEPYPSVLFTTVRDSGAQGAAAVLTALSPGQLLAVLVGFTLTVTCVRKTLRHPDRLAPHDRISGIRNATLPHSRAIRAARGAAQGTAQGGRGAARDGAGRRGSGTRRREGRTGRRRSHAGRHGGRAGCRRGRAGCHGAAGAARDAAGATRGTAGATRAARDTARATGAARDAAGADTQTAAQSPVQAAAWPGDRAAPVAVAVAQDADDAPADADASGRPLATAATTGSAAEAQGSAADSR
ncbi:teicoplanin resistance protein VanZ [Streptomyces malaysiensis subsp. malaysiensis]|uniref:VanZ family protein n=1 Tax=Streptomyces malaysiensis TaxID=92644 RepID=UPI00115DDF1C|nr:VanZ family protein [Streptomyces malaysiensis]QDL72338.1 teicoplanin resistance protein VanZ [Streptomyces malaysiensis]